MWLNWRPSITNNLTIDVDKYQEMVGIGVEEDFTKHTDWWNTFLEDNVKAARDSISRGIYEYQRMSGMRGLGYRVQYLKPNSLLNKTDKVQVIIGYVRTSNFNSPEQEKYVRQEVDKIFAPGGALYEYRADNDLKSDYEKYLGVWAWFSDNIKYDYESYSHASYTGFTTKKFVCDAYSALSTLMLQRAGIEAIPVFGIYNRISHGWIVIKIGDKFYSTDFTDSSWRNPFLAGGGPDYKYGRKRDGATQFDRDRVETLKYGYQITKLVERHVMDRDNQLKEGIKIDSGRINSKDPNNKSWKIDWVLDSGVLKISGSGQMRDFESPQQVPWHDYLDDIKSIEIDPKISYIGKNAFAGIKAVSLASTPSAQFESMSLGENAFADVTEDKPAVKDGKGAEQDTDKKLDKKDEQGDKVQTDKEQVDKEQADNKEANKEQGDKGDKPEQSEQDKQAEPGKQPESKPDERPEESSVEPPKEEAGKTPEETKDATDTEQEAEGDKAVKETEAQPQPVPSPSLNGWVYEDDSWYYYNSGTRSQGWLLYQNDWYYLDPVTKKMALGWNTINGDRYYFMPGGYAAKGWLELDGLWYHFHTKDCYMQKGWLPYKNSWYYLDQDGAMQTDWIRYNNKWYYLGDDGIMQRGWILYNSSWYYLKADGDSAQGWNYISGKWYYFEPNNTHMLTGWLKDNNKWYYLKPGDGYMLTGTHYISGLRYSFNSDGSLRG